MVAEAQGGGWAEADGAPAVTEDFPSLILYRWARLHIEDPDAMTETLNHQVEENERVLGFSVVGSEVLVLIEREEVMGPWVTE